LLSFQEYSTKFKKKRQEQKQNPERKTLGQWLLLVDYIRTYLAGFLSTKDREVILIKMLDKFKINYRIKLR